MKAMSNSSLYDKSYHRNLSICVTNENKLNMVKDEQYFQLSITARIVLIAINLILAVFGTFGNFLIIFAVLTTPQIREKVSNFILLSLAVADLLVTMIAQPLYAAQLIATFFHRWDLVGRIFKVGANVLGVLSALSSLYHLSSISIDRAICTVKPHQHRFIIKNWYKVMIIACWGTAFVTCCSYFVFLYVSGKQFFSVPLLITIPLIPLLSLTIMLCSYGTILYKVTSRQISPATPALSTVVRDRAMENRVSGTIRIVILLFFACWIPAVLYVIAESKRFPHCETLTLRKFPWFATVIFSNSSMNVLVYSLRIRYFRVACQRIIVTRLHKFREVVACCCNSNQNTNNLGL